MTVTDSISPSSHASDFLPGPGIRGLVSVIVPCYNRADIVGETIDSLLRQTYADLEIIAVDDGSTDDTRQVIASYTDERVRYFYKPNGGLSAARNYGLAMARGEFIAFLDSDDLWRDWKLASQMRLFAGHPEVGMIWSDMSTFATAGEILSARHLRNYYSAYEAVEFERHHRPIGVLSDLTEDAPPDVAGSPYYIADIFQHMFKGNLVHPSTAIVRRGRLRESGPFEPEVTGQGGEDYHFYFRICSKGQVAFLDAPTTLYRIHAAQLSTCNRLKEAHGNLSVITHWVNRKPEGLPTVVVRNSLASAHAWLGAEELNAGNTRAAAAHLWKSLTLRCTDASTLRLFLISMLPPSIVDVVRSVRRGVRHAMVRRISVLLLLFVDDLDTLMDLTDLLCSGAVPSF
jgi:glycosyltransferase involved in cell wall biosynthesis